MFPALPTVHDGGPDVASFPGLRHFRFHEEPGGPGMVIFSHMREVKGRKVVERT